MRFNLDAETREAATAYLRERAVQLRADGFKWSKEIIPLEEDSIEWGVRTHFAGPDKRFYQSIYVYAQYRHKGYYKRTIEKSNLPVLTAPGCQLGKYLWKKGIPFEMGANLTSSSYYRETERYYNDRRAERSQVYLMRHIDEGMIVLHEINANDAATFAYILHPLVQEDAALRDHVSLLTSTYVDPYVLLLVMEYRNVANSHLLRHNITKPEDITLSPIAEVNDMLIADKVQNRKDFRKYHYGTHPQSAELELYFSCWLERLGVSENHYEELVKALDI